MDLVWTCSWWSWELPVLRSSESQANRWADQKWRVKGGPRSRALLDAFQKSENGVFDLVCL